MNTIKNNIEIVNEKIEKAVERSGRSSGSVKLVIVTKTQPLEVIQEVVRAGGKELGENYPEETFSKLSEFNDPVSGKVRWHMIGHLQSRKARIVAQNFDMLQSLDSVKLAQKLDGLVQGSSKSKFPVLLQCNVSGEASKGGFEAWDEGRWSELLPDVEQIIACDRLKIMGLMTMPPLSITNSEEVRPYFSRLRKLRDFFARQYSLIDWTELSMGTSHDYEVAIDEGATFVRVGTSIVGERKKG